MQPGFFSPSTPTRSEPRSAWFVFQHSSFTSEQTEGLRAAEGELLLPTCLQCQIRAWLRVWQSTVTLTQLTNLRPELGTRSAFHL